MAELVGDVRFTPDYGSYRGTAYYGRIDFATLRTGIPDLDKFLSWLVNTAVRGSVEKRGGRMLEAKTWRTESSYGIVPTYDWTVESWWYFPATAHIQSAAIPAVVYAIIQAILLIVTVIAIWAVVKEAKELVWGGGEGGTPWIAIAVVIGVVGFAFTPIAVELLKKR